MLLQQAAAYARTLSNQQPAGYQNKPIRYIIDLDASGDRAHITDVRPGPKSRGLELSVPHAKRSSGIRPILFADYGTYTLGVPREKDAPERGPELLEAYRALVERCAARTGSPDVGAIATFLRNLPGSMPKLPADFDPAANITFEVAGVRVIDLPEVQSFWADELGLGAEDEPAEGGFECIVCGNQRDAVRVHPLKIKGILAGQSGGTDLISANNDAYFSYGLENSLTAPTCASCAEMYANGLNALLASAKTHTRVAGVEYCCWVKSGKDTAVIPCLEDPESEDAMWVIASFTNGNTNALREFKEEHFYATSLSGNGARAVVLSWLDSTLLEAYEHIVKYFEAHSIVAPDGGAPTRYPLRRLANAMVRDPAKQQPPRGDIAAMMRFALAGSKLPLDLLNQAVIRCRAEQGVRRDRAALLKMVLVSRERFAEVGGLKEMLDPAITEPAYVYGRLFSVLNDIQYAALGSVNASVVDRFYGAASATPAAVFGLLIRNAQNHLKKMRRDKKELAANALEARMEELLGFIPSVAGKMKFEKTLGLEGQGVFALGFYHQRAYSRAQAKERAAARDARGGTATAQSAVA